jgi:hypothetical protein
MEQVWQVTVREEELLFLATLMAMFHQSLDENVLEFARGLTAATAFAEQLGRERYTALWKQLNGLLQTSPMYRTEAAMKWPEADA